MTLTKVRLHDGSEHVIRYHHSVIEEAAALGEITTSLEGKTVALEDVTWWSAEKAGDRGSDVSSQEPSQ